MIEGFDKEIDFLLRQTAQRETAPGARVYDSVHLDADEISAFAENALPEKIRRNYILHLADCERCRKILSNLTDLNAVAQSEIIHAKESAVLETIAPKIPWYRRFLTVPALAYSMGALVLLFSGLAVFTVLQNNSENSQVSQISEKQLGGKGMASDGEARTQESFSNSMSNTATVSNTAANTALTNSAVSIAPKSANSNSTLLQGESNRSSIYDAQPTKSPKADNKSADTKDAVVAGALPAAPPPPAAIDKNEADDRAAPMPVTEAAPDMPKTQRAPMPAMKMRKAERPEEAEKKSGRDSVETTGIGGKTFKRSNNVWIDSAYRGQPTMSVSRGTNEYKKLDAGLRGIAENLGGTVVIVWKEKAYRIQ